MKSGLTFKKIIAILSAAVIGLHLAFRNNYNVMHKVSVLFVTPLRQLQSKIASFFPFSLAEALMAVVLVWIIWSIAKKRWKKLLTGAVTLSLFVWAAFSLMWGTYYYGTPVKSTSPVSDSQLAVVTAYFADLTNKSYRDEPSKDEIIEKSKELNDGIGCKGIVFSKVMSLVDFSGFFFPPTGEANVNLDMPSHDLAATCAHEIAHLNGIPTEQEANFEAVRTSLEFGDEDYIYSASLMAYSYLGNALHDENYELWCSIYWSLSEEVRQDLTETSEYWAKYKTPVKEVSNTVYENFLYSNGQELGLKSYGACVDLLVNYYYDTALEYFMEMA